MEKRKKTAKTKTSFTFIGSAALVVVAILAAILYSDTSNYEVNTKENLAEPKNDAEIVILNPVQAVKENSTWIVYFETNGTADLIITSPNAKWEELPNDNPETLDEMKLSDIKCGEKSLMSKVMVAGEDAIFYPYTQFNGKINAIKIENYNCNELSTITHDMNIVGYAQLKFSYGQVLADALDPHDSCVFNPVNIDGDLTVSSGTTTINTVASSGHTTGGASGTSVNVASTSGFAKNDRILVMRMKGGTVGQYEIGQISSISGNTLIIYEALSNTYSQTTNSRCISTDTNCYQVVRIPHYNSVTLTGGTLTAPAWDPNTGTGGVLWLESTNSISIS